MHMIHIHICIYIYIHSVYIYIYIYIYIYSVYIYIYIYIGDQLVDLLDVQRQSGENVGSENIAGIATTVIIIARIVIVNSGRTNNDSNPSDDFISLKLYTETNWRTCSMYNGSPGEPDNAII